MKNKLAAVIKRFFKALFSSKKTERRQHRVFDKTVKMALQALFRQKRAQQGTAGFSLIELLVVIGIIGVLAAVAVPAYRSQQESAIKASINSSLQTIGKAANQCMITKAFTACDTLAEIEVSCPDCGTPQTNSGAIPICVGIEKEAVGTKFNGCVSSSGGIATITRSWSSPCNTVEVTYTCNSGGTGYDPPTTGTCSSLGCTATTVPAASGTTCTANTGTTGRSCKTANASDMTTSGAHMGECLAAGTCN